MAITLNGSTWYGFEASEYAKECGFLDYRTFSQAFAHILNNTIISEAANKGFYFEIVNGEEYNEEEDRYIEIFQYYIVPAWAVEEIFEDTEEIIYYCEALDLYIWGVTHYGTAWDYVLTDIKINAEA